MPVKSTEEGTPLTPEHETVVASIVALARSIPIDEDELRYIRWYLTLVIANVERVA